MSNKMRNDIFKKAIANDRCVGKVTISTTLLGDLISQGHVKEMFKNLTTIKMDLDEDKEIINYTFYSDMFRKLSQTEEIPSYVIQVVKRAVDSFYSDRDATTEFWHCIKWAEKLENDELRYLDIEEVFYKLPILK